MKSILRVPQFEDPEKQRISQLLHIVIMVLLLPLPLTYLIQVVSVEHAETLQRTILTLFHAVLMFVLLSMMHRGHVQTAATLMACWLWIGLAIQVTIKGTIDSPSFSAFTLAIIVGGLLTGARGLYLLTLSTTIFSILFFFIETHAFKAVTPSLFTSWGIDNGTFLTSGMFLYIVTRSLQTSAETAQSSEQEALRMAENLRNEMAVGTHLREQLQMIYDQALDMMVVTDIKGHYQLLNPAVTRILGYEIDEMLNMRAEDFVHPDDIQKSYEVRATLDEDHSIRDFENRYRHKDGTYRLLSWTVSILGDQILAFARDITEQRALETDQIQFEADKRMVAMRQDFVARVSHEFRTPLSIIQISQQMLDRYHERLTEEQRLRHLTNIRTQTGLMTQMIEEILLISKFNSGGVALKNGPVWLEDYCYQLFKQIMGRDPLKHNVQYHYDGPENLVQLDTSLLNTILGHLLSNAVKFTPEGGTIQFNVGQESNQSMLIFQIRDSGIGISSDFLSRIYNPFSRGENATSITGTGLGLTIVRDCVEQHNGTITVESEDGAGTSFTVRLPLVLSVVPANGSAETSTGYSSPSG